MNMKENPLEFSHHVQVSRMKIDKSQKRERKKERRLVLFTC
jgi:hypothetical protein